MNIKRKEAGDGVIYSLVGKFTFSDHANFRKVIDSVKDSNYKSVTLDIENLDFVDSAALGLLLVIREETEKAGLSLSIKNPTGQVKKMFDLSNFNTLFNIV
jgi:anti-anti-sigma factor